MPGVSKGEVWLVDFGMVAETPAEEKPAKETKPEDAKEVKAEASK